MATEERKEDDLFIKDKAQRRTKNFFVTSSAKMDDKDGVNATTISSSVFQEISKSFADGTHLLNTATLSEQGPILYMLQEMQADIDDVYNEVSASAFQASFFPFARIDSGSIGVFSSSLIPDKDDSHNLGSSTHEWKNLYVNGTAYIDSLDLNGTNINTTLNAKALKTHISGAFTSLSASIATDINNAGGGGGGSGNYDTASNLIPHADNTYDLGSKTKEWKNLYVDGVAHIDSLAGTTLTAPIRTLYRQVTAMKTTTLDAQSTDVFEFNISKPVTVDLITPLFAGQEITIMNIGAGAVTITRSQGGKATSIYNAKGASLTINQHEAYKFVCNRNQLWYVIS